MLLENSHLFEIKIDTAPSCFDFLATGQTVKVHVCFDFLETMSVGVFKLVMDQFEHTNSHGLHNKVHGVCAG